MPRRAMIRTIRLAVFFGQCISDRRGSRAEGLLYIVRVPFTVYDIFRRIPRSWKCQCSSLDFVFRQALGKVR